jgi:hypothetical protein
MVQNQLVLQIIPSILEGNFQRILQKILRKKILPLKERRNLRVEVIDQKTLPLKNTVKKGLKPKIF